jgi:hypothetical protein
MNDFDQAARYQVKNNAAAHLAWLFPNAMRRMQFARWLDSQSAPRPGEPDRRCDTIAELTDRAGTSPPRAVVVELFTAADAEALDRTTEYLGRFRRELRHGPHDRDKYPFLAAMIFLTGACSEKALEADLPDEEDVETTVRPRVLELAGQDGVAFLDAIGNNRLPAGLLAWGPLLRGGQTPEFVRHWLDLSAGLGDMERRIAGSLALTFSDLTDSRPIWEQGLKELNMNESSYLHDIRTVSRNEGRNEGRVESHRENLLRVLRSRFRDKVSGLALARVEEQADPAILSKWIDLALAESSWESFVAALDT